jgi:hypothetical protein
LKQVWKEWAQIAHSQTTIVGEKYHYYDIKCKTRNYIQHNTRCINFRKYEIPDSRKMKHTENFITKSGMARKRNQNKMSYGRENKPIHNVLLFTDMNYIQT